MPASQMRLKEIALWVLLGAAAFHAAYASIRLSFLILVYLFALVQLAQAATFRKGYYSGLAVGFLLGIGRLEFFWTIFSGGAVALWYVYAFWIGLFVALSALCLRKSRSNWGWLLIPFLWVGLEYFRSELYYLRFSWLSPGYALAALPWPLPLHWLGTYGVGFVLVGMACVAAFVWKKSPFKGTGVLVLLASCLALASLGLPSQPRPQPGVTSASPSISNSNSLRIAGIQLEIPIEQEILAGLDDLLRKHPDTELVVLSEYTFMLENGVPPKIRDWCRKHQRYLIVGGKDPAPRAQYYNTAFVIGPAGDIIFRQVKAVPIQFFKDGLPAPEQKLWDSPWGKIGICVCYDLSYTRVTDRLIQLGAQALIVPTMDVMDWGRRQHELHARIAPVRAAEYGVPIFRLASSGISQWVDGTGHILGVAPCPGQGEILAGALVLHGPGALPLDRWLAPFSTFLTAVVIVWLLIAARLKSVLRLLLRLLYGFRAFNEAELKVSGPVLLLPNHVSWWDWLLLGVCLEDDWRFVTSSQTAETTWIHKRIMVNSRTFPVDMGSPYAVKHMAAYLRNGGRLVLFPEGQLSRTGSLMKLFDGTGFLIAKTHAKVMTAYLRGAERLPYSRNPLRKQWFPRLSVHFSQVLTPPQIEGLTVTKSREILTDWVREQMVKQRFETEMEIGPATLSAAIRQAARGRSRQVVIQDATMQPLSYRRLLLGSELLSAEWTGLPAGSEGRIGLLLPNVNAFPVVLLSLWSVSRVPAILNYAAGPATMLVCARLAGLSQIITSKAFLERLRLDPEIFRNAGLELILLEDVRARIPRARKVRAMLRQFVGLSLSTSRPPVPTAAAVVLFTSGSEGDPKAVSLSHGNLLANIRQMRSVIDLMETDRVFNAMPLFHSFGLTIGLLLPLIEGVYTFLYLSPLHYRVVPSAFYNLDCTILFGTNTFLAGYARKANPYDFRSLRYLFAGAEKVQESTSSLWMRKFGVRILEGYGATECSPCLSVNLPVHPRHGSAGRFLPGIEYKLEPVEGIESEEPHAASHSGRLFVRGPNIMRGYLNPEANAKFQALGGWYDTGDIVRVDSDGFVFILGRLKRFAKVSGEMVSLTAVEDALAGAFPEYGLKFAAAVLARPDESRGEQLVVITNEPRLTMQQVRAAIHARGLNNLAVPRELKLVRQIPLLGSGKVNHRELEKMI